MALPETYTILEVYSNIVPGESTKERAEDDAHFQYLEKSFNHFNFSTRIE